VKNVSGHCYDDSGAFFASVSENLFGNGECDNNRWYTMAQAARVQCELDIVCFPEFHATAYTSYPAEIEVLAWVNNRKVNWVHNATGYSPTDCLASGCEDSYENVQRAPCPNMCPSQPPPGEGGEGSGPDENASDQPGGGDNTSPIVIDINKHGFRFTSAAEGVAFDIDGDGSPEQIAWVDPASGDAFLVLDRNGNGMIDDGTELFGNFTPQPYSDSPNGYEALLPYDEPSFWGNRDGLVAPDDSVWSSLKVWFDDNKNGVSEPWELVDLSDAGISAISLGYRSSNRKDRHGNQMRYLSKVYLKSGHWVWSTDVFFVVQE
jgi:hypothetical protein